MKLLVVTLGLLGLTMGEAPYPPAGSRPQGALLVLPPRQQYSAPQPAAPAAEVVRSISLDRLGELITERLRQSEASQSGNYYVARPDGGVQNYQYSSAPLRLPSFQKPQQFNYQNAQAFGSNVQVSQQSQQNAQTSSRLQGYPQERPGGEFEESRQSQYRAENSGLATSGPSGQFNQPRGFLSQSEASSQFGLSSQYNQPEASNQLSTRNQFSQPALRNQYGQPQQAGINQYSQQSERLTQKQLPGRIQGNANGRYSQKEDAAQVGEGAASNQHVEAVPSQQPPRGVNPQQADQPEANQQDPAAVQPQQQLLQAHQPYQQLQPAQLQELQPAQLQQLQPAQFHQLQTAQLQQLQDQQQWTASYVASVQVADVQPISAPIYSYTPLVRILRYAPKY